MLFRLPIINPMQEKIFEKYNDLYQIVKETLRPISDSFDSKLPDEEVAFLTMHFALLIKKILKNIWCNKKWGSLFAQMVLEAQQSFTMN